MHFLIHKSIHTSFLNEVGNRRWFLGCSGTVSNTPSDHLWTV